MMIEFGAVTSSMVNATKFDQFPIRPDTQFLTFSDRWRLIWYGP